MTNEAEEGGNTTTSSVPYAAMVGGDSSAAATNKLQATSLKVLQIFFGAGVFVYTGWCYRKISNAAVIAIDGHQQLTLSEKILLSLFCDVSGGVNGALFSWSTRLSFMYIVQTYNFDAFCQQDGTIDIEKLKGDWHNLRDKLKNAIPYEGLNNDVSLTLDDISSVAPSYLPLLQLTALNLLCMATSSIFMYMVARDAGLSIPCSLALTAFRAFLNAFALIMQHRYYKAGRETNWHPDYVKKFCLTTLLTVFKRTLSGIAIHSGRTAGVSFYDFLNLAIMSILPSLSYNSYTGEFPDQHSVIMFSGLAAAFFLILASVIECCSKQEDPVPSVESVADRNCYCEAKSSDPQSPFLAMKISSSPSRNPTALGDSFNLFMAVVPLLYTIGYYQKTSKAWEDVGKDFGITGGPALSAVDTWLVSPVAFVLNAIFNMHFVQLGLSVMSGGDFLENYSVYSNSALFALFSIGVGVATDLWGTPNAIQLLVVIFQAGASAFFMNFASNVGYIRDNELDKFCSMDRRDEETGSKNTYPLVFPTLHCLVPAGIFAALCQIGKADDLYSRDYCSLFGSILIMTAASGALKLGKVLFDLCCCRPPQPVQFATPV